MADATERSRDLSTDLDLLRRQWFSAGAESERARIRAVQEQSLPGHEALIQTLMFDGKTTGLEAAVQILAAEKKKLAGIAAARGENPADHKRKLSADSTLEAAFNDDDLKPGVWDIAAEFMFCVVKPGE